LVLITYVYTPIKMHGKKNVKLKWSYSTRMWECG